jgi:hypothetical protein
MADRVDEESKELRYKVTKSLKTGSKAKGKFSSLIVSEMNELNINILQTPPRSKVRRIIGVFYILISVLWLVMRIVSKEPVTNRATFSFFDIIYTFFFGLAGIVFIIDGSGISISTWFGEAYIKIDARQIYIKKSVFSKEWILLWSEVERVEYSVIGIKFRLADRSFRELNYNNMDYGHIQEIKQMIKSIAEEKNIVVI